MTAYDFPLITYPVNNLSIFLYNSPFNAGASGGASLLNQFRAPIGAVFAAQDLSLLHANGTSHGFDEAVNRAAGPKQAVKICRRDLWRNVRIPFLHLLPRYQALNRFEWVNVPQDTIPEYSSLIGVPTRGIPSAKGGNCTFSLQSNYQVLKCDPKWISYRGWLQKNNDSQVYGTPTTESFCQGLPNIQFDILRAEDRTRVRYNELSPMATVKPRTLMFYTINNLTFCEISTEYVEASVDCPRAVDGDDLSCSVTRMRHNPKFGDGSNITSLDMQLQSRVLQYIPCTMASSHPSESGLLEKWLKNPPTTFQESYDQDMFWYEDISMNVFQNRLAMVLNTFTSASLNMTNTVGSDGLSISGRGSDWAQTTGTWSEFTPPVYRLIRSWFLLCLISTFVLAACALANVVLRSMIHAPDFLGSVSALTRDSLFVDVPTPAGTLDGSERSRLLQDKYVMIQDVKPDDEIGRIAFSDAPAFVPLRKDRLYM